MGGILTLLLGRMPLGVSQCGSLSSVILSAATTGSVVEEPDIVLQEHPVPLYFFGLDSGGVIPFAR